MGNKMMMLGAFFQPTGHHVASWRHPNAPLGAAVSISHYMELARLAEHGMFDLIFLADTVAVRQGEGAAFGRTAAWIANFEPITLLSALSSVTRHIGLIATASTSYNHPYHVARQFASLDHLSNGRAGWNIVTSSSDAEAKNFGRLSHFEHEQRYRMAREFTDVVRALWDSWDNDAFVDDRKSGLYFDPSRMHPLDHIGEYFVVKGPLNVPRSPQGHPILVQAGGSETGRDFASEYADIIFSAHLTLDEARRYYEDVKTRAIKAGRTREQLIVLPGLTPLVGRTPEEAKRQADELQALVDPIVARDYLSLALGGQDLTRYSLDEELPDLPRPNTSHSSFETTMALARRERLTIRQLSMRMAAARIRVSITGTPAQIADHMEQWLEADACDGFNILPPLLPKNFIDFVELVIPELQRRGRVKTEYAKGTLRQKLGLRAPPKRRTRE